MTKRFSILNLLPIALLLVLLADFVLWERRGDIRETLPPNGAFQEFSASMTVRHLAFDDRTESATATLDLEIKAARGNRAVRTVTYGYQNEADGTSSDLLSCDQAQDCFTQYEDVPAAGARHLTTARIRKTQVPILLKPIRSEIWYPFDKFAIPFSFHGWVNEDGGNGEPNLAFEQLLVKDSEPNFELRQDSGECLLVRRPFLRIVSLFFLCLSLAFLKHLKDLTDANDFLAQSLGFIGALWIFRSLLLPPTTNVFPTVIDYVVLTELCLVFGTAIARILSSKEPTTTP